MRKDTKIYLLLWSRKSRLETRC